MPDTLAPLAERMVMGYEWNDRSQAVELDGDAQAAETEIRAAIAASGGEHNETEVER